MQVNNTIKCEFQISDWQEQSNNELSDERKITTAVVKQTYSGDISGTSEVRYHMYYSSGNKAVFNGFERLQTQLNNSALIIILSHKGVFEDGKAKADFVVIDSIPVSDFIGKHGHFESSQGGKANFVMSV